MLVNGNQAKEALVAVGASVHYSYNKIGLCYSHPVLGEGKIGIIRWVAPDILSEEEVTEHLYILCFQKSESTLSAMKRIMELLRYAVSPLILP
ncbi:hypothetical protein EBZ38_06485 [bacterium]|nr:hypothetical protein [bacterium]